jgi:hypothetical protein
MKSEEIINKKLPPPFIIGRKFLSIVAIINKLRF